ncbi:ATP-grasp domain-containing protein [Pseudorhodoferax sp.]|uniref:ATP-grasp domain-containing protein n=1 Tax=Pseudorhodoferax sp. TaxID=1993553 RepID=UPI002DD619A3|nr:ATP-grasp domain-containing protein [Pseudorhodoferax sp.]
MMLVEADGKRLLHEAGIAVPPGRCWSSPDAALPVAGTGPWMAKAQVPVGGRGKAGGVRPVPDTAQLHETLAAMFGLHIKGHVVREVLVEQQIGHGATEHYLAILVDAGSGALRLLYTARGGMDVESIGFAGDEGFSQAFSPDAAALQGAIEALAATVPATLRAGLVDVARRLGSLVLAQQLLLAEINPLFADDAGHWVAGDAKVVIDMNAVPRQPALRSLLTERQAMYPDAWRKLSEDFDFVEIDPDGRVGLVTTGAGLSMMLIDELVAQGVSPFNFCDMRTGQMRGSPARLLLILDWLAQARDVRVLLVNIFAGITDLSEFTQLLVDALRARPGFRRPVVARLVGNGQAAAQRIVADHPDLGIRFEPDLEAAITLTKALLQASAPSEDGRAD